MYREPTALRIVFPDPGYFLTDTRLEVDLDGVRVYEGSATSGFEHRAHVSPGQHQLVTRIAVGPILRPRTYLFTVGDEPTTTITLRYSRFWGNFTRRLRLTAG